MTLKIIFLLLIVCAPAVSAQSTNTLPVAQLPSAAAPLLTPEHVYNLLTYSIIGSLGALGLLLGLDKVIILLFRFGSNADSIQKYSSESVARILPIVIEGITVILVILTLIILGASRIISAEGTVGILGAVVGYVLGKSTRKGTPPKNGPTA